MFGCSLHLLFVVSIGGCFVGCAFGIVLRHRDKRSVLDQINRLREFTRSSNAVELVWSEELEEQAEAWTSACSARTPVPSGIGINTFLTDRGRHFRVLWAVSKWACQIKKFLVKGPSCYKTECGEYSQAVWAGTSRVGCAYEKCPTVVTGNGSDVTNGLLFACLFSVVGNVDGEYPFDWYGRVCSRCPSGSGWCTLYGLCKSDCTKASPDCRCLQSCSGHGDVDMDSCRCSCHEGWMGTDCSRPCKDSRDCEKIALSSSRSISSSVCEEDFFRKRCPKTCKLC